MGVHLMKSNIDIENVPFGSLLEEIVDNRGRTCPIVESGFPLIATNCVTNDYLYPQFSNLRFVDQKTYDTWFRGHPKPGDMLFVLKGTPGRTAWVTDPVPFCIAQDMVAIRANQAKVYPKYLFAVLRSAMIQQEIEGLHVGSLIPHFKKGDFNTLSIPVVKSTELQTFIGDQYFHFCLKIDLLHRQNKTLEAMAETLFRQWFVEEASDDWEMTSFADHFDAFRGLSYRGSGLTERGLGTPMHNLNSVYEGGGYKDQGIKYYSGEFKDRHVVRPGDVIVANTEQGHEFRLIGYPAIVPSNFGKIGIFSQHIYRLVRKESSFLSNEFIYFQIMTPDVREQITSATNGSTVNMLAIDGLQRPTFRLPPKHRVDEFSVIARQCRLKTDLNKRSIRQLETLRDTLLPKLMSGEVRVANE